MNFHFYLRIIVVLFYKNELFCGKTIICNGLYVLDVDTPVNNINIKQLKSSNLNNTYLWHCHLGHINETRMSNLHKNGYLSTFDYESYGACKSCLLGKMTKSPFKRKGERATEVLGLVHTDVCGPMSTDEGLMFPKY